jgi:hypothetical protein
MLLISNRQIELIKSWLSERTHRERVGLLFLGCAFIYMLWFLLIQKPLNQNRMDIRQQIQSAQKQTAFFENESKNILNEAAKSAKDMKSTMEQQRQFESLNIHFASPVGNDTLLKAILTPYSKIKFMSLTKTPGAAAAATPATTPATPETGKASSDQEDKGSYQLIFHSNYLDTLAYLEQLEKLPWCLSWDSLEYKTLEYPEAEVVVNLHIVSA